MNKKQRNTKKRNKRKKEPVFKQMMRDRVQAADMMWRVLGKEARAVKAVVQV